MTPERWHRLQGLFHQAVTLPAAQRPAFLSVQCDGDPELAAEVARMLVADAGVAPLLDAGVAPVADQLLNSPEPVPAVPHQLGPYRIEGKIGEGGMGVVYAALREDLGNRVAIKVLRDAWVSPARRERFVQEQRILAQLSHPAIARLYDADTTDDGTPFFVMEFVAGMPLTAFCEAHGSDLAERLRLFQCVCEAVGFAHQHAVIHRDLKPSNLLVRGDGSVCLLDFGIARHLDQIGGLAQPTVGLQLLTPAYAAPEQLRGEPVGVQADVFALGVILRELLEAAGSQLTIAGARADLEILFRGATHPDPARRYASVEALSRDVTHFLRHEPLEAGPDRLSYRLGKFLRRNRRAVLALGGAAAAVAAMALIFTFRLAQERDYARRQAAIANTVNQFLADDLLARGNPFQSGQAEETLSAAIRHASPAIDRKFAAEPEIAARLHLTIAQALSQRSAFVEARPEFETAGRLFLRAEGPESENALATELEQAAMEARSFDARGVPNARRLLAAAQAQLRHHPRPRPDLAVRLADAQGMLALVQGDAHAANQYFQQAVASAAHVPGFNPMDELDLRQRLAFTYIRLGDGVAAERQFRSLAAAYAARTGAASPYVLRVRLNLAQSYMVERKFEAAVAEANAVYPDFVARLGPDHELTMQLLATRAQSEGSLGNYAATAQDDLTVYRRSVRKQGPLAFYSIATLADASTALCRAGQLRTGERDARTAYAAAVNAFGPRGVLTQGAALPLANCLIGLGRLPEASALLAQIDGRAVAQLAGDPDWGAGVTLAQAEIAVRQRHWAQARKDLAAIRAVFLRPDAETFDRMRWRALQAALR